MGLLSQSSKKAFRNPWVIGWITLILIVLGVNIAFISLAVVTNPGLVSDDYYERGQDHEKNINTRKAARSALGWQVSLDVPTDTTLGRETPFRFTAVDKVGRPLVDGSATLHAYRPSDAAADFEVAMFEKRPGQYVAPVVFPLKGYWRVIITLQRGEDSWELTEKVNVLVP
ncbi:hypothetical protein BOW53_05445 [Solemya pervernicosa gill symbiont]|uniref:Nitrogen fixation protein FixH n=2 Tax=Gammaproteobacteria incertae sedis TaxID=118884 RepID=A0A1T2L7I1_9GAMM|nr:FixH family protein [Candidatus Reidiella endopervernicosa]OOZ41041.1 hypothetical protein BOW53_05445 [Solemya pervernicosa gill symbiont]QKQ25022.1 FixH family protein [Candidatus Reidiella endopervernicosa]